MKGTHRCLNLSTLREVTGDTFRPAPLTTDAIIRLKQLTQHQEDQQDITSEPLIDNPNTPYSLDPTRGVDNEIHEDTESHDISLIPADSFVMD